MLPCHVFLIGLRGSGKSRLAPLLAAHFGVGAIDLDARALALTGAAAVADVWEHGGEAAWRRAERTACDAILGGEAPAVIAMGGGAPTDPGIRRALRDAEAARRAIILLLDVPLPDLVARRREDAGAVEHRNRPALRPGESLDNEVIRTAHERLPAYRALATAVVSVPAGEPPAVTAQRMAGQIAALAGSDRSKTPPGA
ncbi:MAG: hypothetical protein KF817_00285 [Phycisphaeraceae bacterium]|nr:hypothetical protein [Phycisphaeraceae bacterium]